MTTAERIEQERDGIARFYAREPPGNEFQLFRCYKCGSRQFMKEEECKARAAKPEMFGDECGGRPNCPRWKHYRKLYKKQTKDDGLERRAYR